MKKFVVYCLLFTVYCLLFSPVHAQQTTIRVMNWNVGSPVPNSGKDANLNDAIRDQTRRMELLARVIKDNSIDVVVIQEMNNQGPCSKCKAKIKHLDVLMESLKNSGWPMYADSLTYEPNGDWLYLVVLSRFPFDASGRHATYDISAIRSKRSALSVVVQETPIGTVRISNFHTHIDEPCNQTRRALAFFQQYDPAITILSGDSNLTFTNFYERPTWSGKTGDTCDTFDWNVVNNTCTGATYSCAPHDTNCRNASQCYGDYLYTFKNAQIFIERMYSIGNVSNISDQHPAIVAIVGSKKLPTVPTTTTPPTPTYTRTVALPTPTSHNTTTPASATVQPTPLSYAPTSLIPLIQLTPEPVPPITTILALRALAIPPTVIHYIRQLDVFIQQTVQNILP